MDGDDVIELKRDVIKDLRHPAVLTTLMSARPDQVN
jgi:hypothetical protein